MLALLLTSMLILGFRIQSVRAEPRTWTVDDDGPADFNTINEAIASAKVIDGDTIFVRSGSYYEHVFLSKAINLVGESRDTVIVDGNSTGTVIEIGVDNVSITNMTIKNAGRTWLGYAYPDSCVSGSNIMNVLIKNNTLTGASVCLWLVYSSLVNVSDNVVWDATIGGIIGYASSNITINHNLVDNCGLMGIHLDGASNNCKIAENTVTNNLEGIFLEAGSARNRIEDNHLKGNNASVFLYKCDLNVLRRNNMTSDQYNLIVWGYDLASFIQDIDESNIVNKKALYYLTNHHDLLIDPSGYPNMGYLALVNCTNITVRDLNVTRNGDGILLAYSTNCSLTNITLSENLGPLRYGGLTFHKSNNNKIFGNEICHNSYAMCLYYSDGNTFYHNSFLYNDKQVVSDLLAPFSNQSSGYFSVNVWDDGYPSGGNYWSDYNGTDLYTGPYQNDTGTDGIGDTRYVINANNQDNYPLIYPWSPLLGDINGDKKVDGKDIAIIAKSFGSYPGHLRWNLRTDINQDSKIEGKDIVLVAKNFGKTYP